MRNIKQLDDKRRKSIFIGIVLACAIVAYNFLWLNRSFTMSEGWTRYYLGLMAYGKIPYRDFFVYLLPFPLLTDFLIWKLSLGYFIGYRLWRLAERVVLGILIYKLIGKSMHKNENAAILTFSGLIIASASVHDLNGDYNQTGILLIVILMVLADICINKAETSKKYLFYMGIVGGLMFCTKQTVFVASAICFAALFVFLKITYKEFRILKSFVFVFLGALIPLLCLFSYLLYNGSLVGFFNCCFNTDSKGSPLDIFLLRPIRFALSRPYIIVAIIVIFIGKCIIDHFELDSDKKKIVLTYSITISSIMVFQTYVEQIWNVITVIISSGFVIIPSIYLLIRCLTKKIKHYIDVILFIGLFISSVIVLMMNINGLTNIEGLTSIGGIAEQIYATNGMDLITEVVNDAFIFILFYVIYRVIRIFVYKEAPDYREAVLLCGALTMGYSWVITTGITSLNNLGGEILFPVFCLSLSRLYNGMDSQNDDCDNEQKTKSIVVCGVYVLLILCISQKLVCNYSWWGDKEESYWNKTEVSEIRQLKGIKFSPLEKQKYENLTELIKQNTDEDDVIFGFPYVKVYNVLLENYNQDTFGTVHFYDVCPKNVAESDASILEEKMPDIVVWHDIPNCMEVHEEVFLAGGRLGQRDIQGWFKNAKDKYYTLIGQVDDVFVYKLGSEEDVKATYIASRFKENITAASYCSLQGNGTPSDPYLVSSLEDLEYIRNQINYGITSYAGEYFKQTADIDMESVENWSPIGLFGSNRYFYGYYNGNGYSIRNLHINDPMANVGLFGLLGGVVYNVRVEDCDVCGACVGAISSHGDYGKIINCQVSGNIVGTYRAGGVADNMGGEIINCLVDAQINAPMNAGITGYYSNEIENCYSNSGNLITIEDGLPFCTDLAEKLNQNISIILQKDEFCNLDIVLNTWTEDDKGEVFITHDN